MTPLDRQLSDAATGVLRANDRGGWTIAAAGLYPHQWSWDAAFVAVGWAAVSVPRAVVELRSLLRGQWSNGMIPHIVFSDLPGYFPGPERWRTVARAPAGTRTSGICQPPVHAIALTRILERGRQVGGESRRVAEAFVADTFDAWLAWHRYLSRERGLDPSGLIEIHHGWESGMDNSPRWDIPYAAVRPGYVEPYTRLDRAHVTDAVQRPGDDDYRRYLWLVQQMATAQWDGAAIRDTVDFRVGDVLITAVLAVASELLADIASGLRRPAEAAELSDLADRCRSAVAAALSPCSGLARDRDIRTGEWLEAATIGGFAPLLCLPTGAVRSSLTALLRGPQWMAHPALQYALPPTTAPDSRAFAPRTYWRGPQWPVVCWLFGWAARHYGDDDLADDLRVETIRQLADGTFAEYYHPLTGEPLGSRNQSWTAAVALDWLGR